MSLCDFSYLLGKVNYEIREKFFDDLYLDSGLVNKKDSFSNTTKTIKQGSFFIKL